MLDNNKDFTSVGLPGRESSYKLVVAQIKCTVCGANSVIYSNGKEHIHACYCGYRAQGSKYDQYWADVVTSEVDNIMSEAAFVNSLLWCVMATKRIKDISSALERREKPRGEKPTLTLIEGGI